MKKKIEIMGRTIDHFSGEREVNHIGSSAGAARRSSANEDRRRSL